MAKKIIMVRLPKIYDASGNLKKKWFVYYRVRDPETGKMVRFKVYEDINEGDTQEERKKRAATIARRYRRKLLNGWRPHQEQSVIYEDVSEYATPGKSFKKVAKDADYSISHFLSHALNGHEVNLRKKSFQSYQSKIRGFLVWLKKAGLEEMDIRDFSTVEAQRFLNELKNTKTGQPLHITTRHSYRTDLKGLFNLLIRQEVLKANPFNNTRLPPKVFTESKRAFQRAEQLMIKEYCLLHDPELWLFIEFIFYCIIRPGELRLLKVNDINIQSQKITMRPEISKNKRLQTVTIPNVFIPRVRVQVDKLQADDFVFKGVGGGAHSKRYFYDRHRKMLDALGFGKDVALYSWKHTATVEFYRVTQDIKSLQEQLRHHSLDQVNTYLHSRGLMDNEVIRKHYPEL